ncbi:MAG: fimbrillin family protein [Rikenellaceae bacterium]
MAERFLMICALALIVASGCDHDKMEDDVVLDGYTPDTALMTFDAVYSGSSNFADSRGSLTGSFVDDDNIGVYAYYTPQGAVQQQSEPNFMNNQLMTKSGNSWLYSPMKHWSTNIYDTFEFQAYAPFGSEANGIVASSVDGMLAIDYMVPEECASQPDLMISEPISQSLALSECVNLEFYHALATVSFKVVGDPSFKVVAISLSGVKNLGTLGWSHGDSALNWSGVKATDTTIEFSAILDENVTSDGDSATTVTAAEGYLMMIPQIIPEEGFTVHVTTMIGSTEVKSELQMLPTMVDEWKVNGRYCYIINLEDQEQV